MTKLIVEYIISNDKVATMNIINKKDISATLLERSIANTLEEYFNEIKKQIFPNDISDILSKIGKN